MPRTARQSFAESGSLPEPLPGSLSGAPPASQSHGAQNRGCRISKTPILSTKNLCPGGHCQNPCPGAYPEPHPAPKVMVVKIGVSELENTDFERRELGSRALARTLARGPILGSTRLPKSCCSKSLFSDLENTDFEHRELGPWVLARTLARELILGSTRRPESWCSKSRCWVLENTEFEDRELGPRVLARTLAPEPILPGAPSHGAQNRGLRCPKTQIWK